MRIILAASLFLIAFQNTQAQNGNIPGYPGNDHNTLSDSIAFLSTDLLGYWPLDGNLSDITGNNDCGKFSQNPRYDAADILLTYSSDASSGQAIDLRGDGMKQMPHIETGLSFSDDTWKTYSLFVKTFDFVNELVWIGSGAPDENGSFDNRAYLGTIQQKAFVGAGKYIHHQRHSNPYPVQDSAWHHYALVIGNQTIKVYQDGMLLKLKPGGETELTYTGTSRSALSKGLFGTSRGFLIGMGGGQRNHPANALIDDVAVFNRVLTQEEIIAIAQLGSVGKWLITPEQEARHLKQN